MERLIPPLLATLLASCSATESIRFDPEPGTRTRKRIETTVAFELDGLSGPIPPGGYAVIGDTTALALVPLTLWFVASIAGLAGSDISPVRAWIGDPLSAILLVLLIAATFHHMQLGLQVVIEDYIHTEWVKITGIVLVKFAAVALAVAAAFAVLKIAFAG